MIGCRASASAEPVPVLTEVNRIGSPTGACIPMACPTNACIPMPCPTNACIPRRKMECSIIFWGFFWAFFGGTGNASLAAIEGLIKLRTELEPYIMEQMMLASTRGVPVNRP